MHTVIMLKNKAMLTDSHKNVGTTDQESQM